MMIGKGRVHREEYLLRLRGKSEKNAFREWIQGYNLGDMGQRKEATRERPG